MTAPTTYYQPTVEGHAPLRIVDYGVQASEPTAEPTEPSQWVEYGGAYSPAEDEPDIRLNLPVAGLVTLLDEQIARLNAANDKLVQAHGQVRDVGPLDHAETWEKVKTEKPTLYDAVIDAERRVKSATNVVRANAAAVERETSARPITLPERDATRAATLIPLIERTVEKGTLADVRDQFRLAISNDDAAALWVYATTVPDRLKAQPKADGDGRVQRDNDPRIKADLAAMVQTARTRLRDDSLTALHTKAANLKVGAGQVENAAGARRRALDVAKSGNVRRDGF